ncbi:hypothetical protein ACVW0I_006313 [Bradyrhizobium sp. LM6.11]
MTSVYQAFSAATSRHPLLPVQAPCAPLRASGARRRSNPTRFRARTGAHFAGKRSCWSFHGFDRATRRHGAAVLVTQPAAADGLHRRDLRQRATAVLGAAAVHENGAAAARRLAGGVVGGDGVLPVAAAGGLRLCAFVDAGEEPHRSGGGASPAADYGVRHVAARHRLRLWRSARFGLRDLAARPVRDLDRAAVLRARRQQSVVAGLVRPHRASCRTRSIFPLCVLQHRQLPRPAILSVPAGANVHAAHAEPALDRRLWHSDPPDRRMRCAAIALAEAGNGRCANRGSECPGAGFPDPAALDLSRWSAVRSAHRRHRAHLDRRCGGAIAVGAAAVAVPPDLGGGVPVAAAAAAQMDADAPAGRDRGRCLPAGVSAANRTCC